MDTSSDQMIFKTPGKASAKKPGRRKTRKSRTQQVLDDLPLGVRFIGRPDQYNESFFLQMQARSLKSDLEKHPMRDESEIIDQMDEVSE